jgi:hypothetical protein
MRASRDSITIPRTRTTRTRRGEDLAPGGSITGQPANVQVSCQQFLCVQLQFRWAAAGPGNITNIVPAPTPAEKKQITNGMFGRLPWRRSNCPPNSTSCPVSSGANA